MKILSTFILTLLLQTCLSQPDTIDTVRTADVINIYKNGVLQEKWYHKNNKIDIKIIYVYRDGVLVSREWWRDNKKLSYTLED